MKSKATPFDSGRLPLIQGRARSDRSQRRIGAGLLLAFSVLISSPELVPNSVAEALPSDPCEPIGRASAEAARRRGLQFKEPVRCEVRSGEEIRSYVSERIVGSGGRERLENEGRLFKVLTLLPGDFDYVSSLVALYSKEVGGFYDPKLKLYAVAADLPPRLRESVAIHELTHALQDQRFGIAAWMADQHSSGDMLLARAALMEGDATGVMLAGVEKAAFHFDSWLDSETKNASHAAAGAQGGGRHDGETGEAVIRAIASFPYLAGGTFVAELRRGRGEKGVNAAFRRPPVSTAEILHPERFGAKGSTAKAARPFESAPAEGLLFSDTLGEFVLRLVLIRSIGSKDAKEIASGWRSDRAELCTGEEDRMHWSLKMTDTVTADGLVRGFSALLSRRHGLVAEPEAATKDGARVLRFRAREESMPGTPREAVIRAKGRDILLGIGPDPEMPCRPKR